MASEFDRSRTRTALAIRIALAAIALGFVVPGWMLLTHEWTLLDASWVDPTRGPVLPMRQLWGEMADRTWKALASGLVASLVATCALQPLRRTVLVGYVVAAAGFCNMLDPLAGTLLILIALCGTGVALWYRPEEAEEPSLPVAAGATPDPALDSTADADRAKLPAALREVLERLEARLREQLAAPKDAIAGSAWHDVQSVARSLPEVLANYRRLAPGYRDKEVLGDGRTCLQHTIDQLLALERALDAAHRATQNKLAQAILVQDRFVRTRFKPDSLA